MSEQEFLRDVITVARLRGWLSFHALPSQKNGRWGTHFVGDAGFPDLVLVHPTGGTVFAELKVKDGRLTTEQKKWGHWLLESGREWYCWYPTNMQEIVDRLSNI